MTDWDHDGPALTPGLIEEGLERLYAAHDAAGLRRPTVADVVEELAEHIDGPTWVRLIEEWIEAIR